MKKSEPTPPTAGGEAKLRTVLDAVADAFFLHDDQGRILDTNRRASESLGYSRDELLGMRMHDVEIGVPDASARQMWQDMQPGDSQTVEGTHRRKDATVFPTETKVGVMSEGEGDKQFVALARDMSHYYRSNKARDVFSSLGQKLGAISSLRDSGLVILSAADDLFGWDTAYIELYDQRTDLLHNIAAFDIIDGQRAEIRQVHSTPHVGSNTHKALFEGPQLVLRRGQEVTPANLPMIGDVSRASASLMFVPIRKDDRPIGVISVQSYAMNAYNMDDLQLLESLSDYCSGAFDRILAQERLREAEQRFTTAFDHAPIGLGLLKPDGDWIRVNRTLCDIVGFSELELLATGLHGITQYEDLSTSLDALLSVFAGDQNFVTFETRLIHRSQRIVCVSFRASLVRDAARQPLYLIAQIQDVTEHRRLERLQSALRSLGQQLVEATSQREVARQVLEAADQLLGWDAAFVDVYHPETATFRSVLMIDTVDGQRKELEYAEYQLESGTNAHRTLREGAQLVQREQGNESIGHPFGSGRRSASLLYVPVRREGKNVGVLSIQSYQPYHYSVEDLESLQELADYCSTAFERAYAESKAAEAELALRHNQQRFEYVMQATNDVIYDWDILTGHIWWNQNIETVFGFRSGEREERVEWWESCIHPDDHDELFASLNAALAVQKPTWSGEYRFRCSDGSYAVVFDRGSIMYRGGRPVRMIGSVMDITQRKRAEEELRHGAYHDPLTGLPNRTYLLQELDRETARAKRHDSTMLGLLFLDLDGFKEVNDSLGHAAGDQLLSEVARVLRDCVRPSDFVARLSGDEFTVILSELHSPADAESVASRILQRLQDPIHLRAGSVHTRASIGIALTKCGSTPSQQLLQQADEAMYKAKAGGRNRYQFYTPPID